MGQRRQHAVADRAKTLAGQAAAEPEDRQAAEGAAEAEDKAGREKGTQYQAAAEDP